MSDGADVLRKLKDFDRETLGRIHETYYPELYHYARYRLDNPDRAEDIAAETLLALLEAVERGQGPHSNLRGWLFRTASNLVNQAFRAQYRQPTEQLDPTAAAGSPPRGSGGESQNLQRALTELTAAQRHVLSLRFGAGLNLEETAQVLNKSIAAVKSLQFRALASLRDQLPEERR